MDISASENDSLVSRSVLWGNGRMSFKTQLEKDAWYAALSLKSLHLPGTSTQT